MWLSWCFVRRTFWTALAALSWSSDLDEQPAASRTQSATASPRRRGLWSIGASLEIGPVPPPAAERLEQGRGVGVAARLGLNEAEARLVVRLLGVEHRKN